PESFGPLAVSVVVHQLYFGFLVLGYRVGDLSVVYPIARGAAPILVAGGAWLVADERLDLVGWSAVAIVSLGIASLALGSGEGPRPTKAVAFGLVTAVTIAGYSLADGLGGRAAGPGGLLGYVALLNVLQAIPFVGYTLLRRRRELTTALVTRWRSTLGGGLFAFGAYGLVIWAMSMTAMSYVSSLREISVVIAAWLGTRLLGEPLGRRRVAAAAVVAGGVVLLQWSRLV